MTHPARTALLLDAGYLDKLTTEVFGVPSGDRKVPLALDYKRLPELLALERPWRTYYYYCMPWVSDPPLPAEHASFEAKQRFIDFLARQRGWVMRQGVLERRGDPRKGFVLVQKRTDVMLAIDLVRLACQGEISRAVLVAGDSDFVPAVAEARAAGVEIMLRYAPGTAHEDLVRAVQLAKPLSREGLEAVRL